MLKEGNVLWLKFRFNNEGDISTVCHPYLIMEITDETIEVAQLDHLDGKPYKLTYLANKIVNNIGETVITERSYMQMDNLFLVEKYCELEKYKKTDDKMSDSQFCKLKSQYTIYHNENEIDENKIVYIDKTELELLNS